MIAVADEELLDFVVHHEPTFNHDEIHRHVTVLALTPTRLIVGHTDDQPAEPPATGIYAASSTESVSLGKINTVVLTRVVNPAGDLPGRSDRRERDLAVGRLGRGPSARPGAGDLHATRSARPTTATPAPWSATT